MNKSIYHKRKVFKIFGKTIFENIEQYEGCDIENCKVVDPIIEQPISFERYDRQKK